MGRKVERKESRKHFYFMMSTSPNPQTKDNTKKTVD
jgi:hypothetical protein